MSSPCCGCMEGTSSQDRSERYKAEPSNGQSPIQMEPRQQSSAQETQDIAMETVVKSYTPQPEPGTSFETSRILYRKELKSGLRTGKRWLKTKYALIPSNSSAKDVVNFLLEKWRLPKPNLVISIVGGTANFHMNIQRREIFRIGIAKAAATTGAWIISSGLNCGIVKTVGEAVKDYAVAAGTGRGRKKVAAIALTSLSEIDGAQSLRDGAMHDRPVVYGQGSERMALQAMLDPNHPYALLVKDTNTDTKADLSTSSSSSTHKKDMESSSESDPHGAEIRLRSAIEHEISTRNITHSSTNVPIVCLLVNGGPHQIRAIHNAIENKTPVLVLAGSKGCANVIAKAYRQNDEASSSLANIMRQEFGNSVPPREMVDLLKKLNEIIKRRHLITIFQLDGVEGVPRIDIDEAFLKALLKGSQGSGKKDQLHMAVVWRRVTLAQSQLLMQYKWKSSELSEALRMALVNDQTDFIRLFLDINVKLEDYLHAGELRRLYNEVHEDTLLFKLLVKRRGRNNKSPVDLSDVGHVIKNLTTHSYEPLYLSDSQPILNPCRELFLWAVLQDRQATARLFWEEGKAWIGGALVASRIMRAMQKLETESQRLADLEEHQREYEKLAVGVLDHCYKEDRRRTSLLLIREMPEWGNVSCLCLAAAAHNKHFIAHPAVQNVLSDLWSGRLSRHNSHWRSILATFVPPYALFGIKFVDEEKDRNYSVTLQTRAPKSRACTQFNHDADDEDDGPFSRQRRDSILSDTGSITFNSASYRAHAPAQNFTLLPFDEIFKHKTVNLDTIMNNEERTRVPWTKRLPLFFSAPAINFRYYVLSHIILLALFSYVLLIDFKTEVTIPEYVLIGWVGTLAIETIRQMISIGGFFDCRKFVRSWLLNYYYLVDAVSVIMFTAGTVIRHYPGLIDAARIVHSLTLVIFYIRLLHIFSVNKHLGPKLIMIIKMMNDLIVFICILLVFLLAYGIACQAVLFPHVTDTRQMMKGIFYRSYFQIYGELFLEELEGKNGCSDVDPDLDPCPSNEWFGTAVLAIYLFVSNVLLLNLLIAMLNYTFALVQENTDIVWKFQRYSLIKEYYNRPILAPPFIIISHVFILYSFLLRCWCGCCDRFAVSRSLRRMLPGDLIAEITTWEKIQGEDYVTKTTKKRNLDMTDRMASTELKLESLSRKSTAFFNNPEIGSQMKDRMDNLEHQMREMKELLQKTLDAVTKREHSSPHHSPSKSLKALDSTERIEAESGKTKEEITREREEIVLGDEEEEGMEEDLERAEGADGEESVLEINLESIREQE